MFSLDHLNNASLLLMGPLKNLSDSMKLLISGTSC